MGSGHRPKVPQPLGREKEKVQIHPRLSLITYLSRLIESIGYSLNPPCYLIVAALMGSNNRSRPKLVSIRDMDISMTPSLSLLPHRGIIRSQGREMHYPCLFSYAILDYYIQHSFSSHICSKSCFRHACV